MFVSWHFERHYDGDVEMIHVQRKRNGDERVVCKGEGIQL